MKQIKMLGNIKWYKKNKGYGYIIGADDETYFFELINCINPNEMFNTGDIVKFINPSIIVVGGGLGLYLSYFKEGLIEKENSIK